VTQRFTEIFHDDKQMILQVQGLFKDVNAPCSVVKIGQAVTRVVLNMTSQF